MGYYIRPKAKAESRVGSIPLLGLIISATKWQLVIFPFHVDGKDAMQCVLSSEQDLFTNNGHKMLGSSALELVGGLLPRSHIWYYSTVSVTD